MERELLAALIVDPQQLDRIQDLVRERDFADPINRKVYRALIVMRENRVPTNDVAILARHLKGTGLPISEVAALVGSGVAANAMYYAQAVLDAGRRLRLSVGLLGALNAMERDTTDLEAVLTDVEALIESERATAETQAVHIAEAGDGYLARLADCPTEAICFSGIHCLDDMVGGFMAGETVILAARPGIGKTSLAMQIGLHNARKGRNGLFVSLEMSKTELVARVLCGMADIDNRRLRRGEIYPNDIERIRIANEKARSLGCWIWDPPRATMAQVESTAKLAMLKHGIRWLVVDYIGLISSGGRRYDRREHIGHCSRSLKELAKELGIPIFVLAQLNREAAAAEPGLENLKESGDIEQDADVVVFIHKEADKRTREEQHSLIVAKHRHGKTGKLMINFDGGKTTFGDVDSEARDSNVYGGVDIPVNGTRWSV